MPIPLETSLIHGIYDDDVKDKYDFSPIRQEHGGISRRLRLKAYNSNRFDVPFLAEEFLRAGIDFDLEGATD